MPESDIDLSGSTILIVDDLPDNLRVLRQALEPQGYQILVASNGEVAIEIATGAHPDLILLDVQMPVMDGFEACRRLKANGTTADIPVIFVTARAETESVVQGFAVGSVDYIVKPFQTEEVLARVDTHLRVDRLARSLSEANRRIGEAAERKMTFLASMSHELRTPITAIKGYAHNMLDGITGEINERQTRSTTRILENTDHLLDLINDILDLSQAEAGMLEVTPVDFDIREVIGSACDAVGTLLRPDVEIRFEIDDAVGRVQTDKARVRQILINLLSNAAKFTPHGTITVSASMDTNAGETILLEVADTGVGIPENAIDLIFEEFRQVDGVDPEHKGNGLGLAITRRLATLLGGGINVTSEVGKGSSFTVHIPAVLRNARTDA